jgi:pyruvate/2-oxoglutarate dehydrogenase complex dihydrolipoamide dehydrogenase (E3) component
MMSFNIIAGVVGWRCFLCFVVCQCAQANRREVFGSIGFVGVSWCRAAMVFHYTSAWLTTALLLLIIYYSSLQICSAFVVSSLPTTSPSALMKKLCPCFRHNTALSSVANTLLYDIIVIGGGSAGLTAAKFAATFDKSVALIESSKLGGDCTWTGCVPSKTILSVSKRVYNWRKMNEKYNGSMNNNDNCELQYQMLMDVKRQIDENRQRIYDHDDSPQVMKSLGIDVIEGSARFLDSKTVVVKSNNDYSSSSSSQQLTSKYGIVLATGATPQILDIKGLGEHEVPYWTYENVWNDFFVDLEQNKSKPLKDTTVIVVGGGPVGCELSQAISRLGCSVVLVSKAGRLLPNGEEIASLELQKVFEQENVDVICGERAVSVTKDESGGITLTLESGRSVAGNHILIATGRKPNTSNMGLDDIGVDICEKTKGISVNDNLETSLKGIYAAGDCTGDRQFTHYAGFQGAIAARNILLPLKDSGKRSDSVPSATFTDPEVASIGLTEDEAVMQHGEDKVSVSFRNLSQVDRAICEDADKHGFMKIVYKTKTKQILGATIMAPSAGELISEIAVARESKLPFDKLSTVMHAYPSYSIALQQMAAEVYYDKLKNNKTLYDVLKKVGL